MIKISIQIESFHSAINRALADLKVDADKVLSAVNDVVGEATERDGEHSGSVKSKEGKKTITVSASGKIMGIQLPKDCPASHLARIQWYLAGSKDYYLRVETIELPLSVREWITAKQFRLANEQVPA